MTDTSDKPADLVQPVTFAGLSERVAEEIEHAFWEMDDKRAKGQSERDAFKWAVRQMFLRIRRNER